MQKKDLAYSFEQLVKFLKDMPNVERIEANVFQYNDARITLTPKEERGAFNTPRCYMELRGDTNDYTAFYKQFLLKYMTMGG